MNLLHKKIIDGIPLIHLIFLILVIVIMFLLEWLGVKNSIKSIATSILSNILLAFITFILLENYRISKIKENFLKRYKIFKYDILQEIISVLNEEEIFNDEKIEELLNPEKFRKFLDEDDNWSKLHNALSFNKDFRENLIRKLSLFREDFNCFVNNFDKIEEKIVEGFWILKDFLLNLEKSTSKDWEESDYLNKITLRFLDTWFGGGDPLLGSKFSKVDTLENLIRKMH